MGGLGSGRVRKTQELTLPPGTSLADVIEQKLKLRQARQNLLSFAKHTKPNYEAGKHHELIAATLERVERGELKRVMFFLPPRHGKSELVSRRFPAWYIGRNDNKQIISSSYNSDLAAEFGRDVRNLIADSRYRAVFPKVILCQDSKAADRWVTQNGGSYLAAGVGSGITGRGADLGLIDDPFKDRAEADSKAIRDKVWNWYTSTFYTRLMPGAAIILCMTRWHENDLAGRLLVEMKKGKEQWEVINLPAICESPDVLGRLEGDALWEAWYPKDTLRQIETTVGTYDWLSLYQQRPASEKGNIFKKTWWKYYREIPKFDFKLQSWDTAFKDKEENDFCVCQTWGYLGAVDGLNFPGYYLIDRFKRKMTYPDLKKRVVIESIKHNPDEIIIEDKASGQSIVQDLQQENTLTIIPIPVDRNKVARSHAVTPLIEAGLVYLPEWATWKEDYLEEMGAFPKAEHDDDPDATTQALSRLKEKFGQGGHGMTTAEARALDEEMRPQL